MFHRFFAHEADTPRRRCRSHLFTGLRLSWPSGFPACISVPSGKPLAPCSRRGGRESPQLSAEIEDFQIGDSALPLTDEQKIALDGILTAEAGTTYLYGPTGTGKTEVFLQAAEKTLAGGRSVIYLVPEIALTGQVDPLRRASVSGTHAPSFIPGSPPRKNSPSGAASSRARRA